MIKNMYSWPQAIDTKALETLQSLQVLESLRALAENLNGTPLER